MGSAVEALQCSPESSGGLRVGRDPRKRASGNVKSPQVYSPQD